jgi:hypothetical protein
MSHGHPDDTVPFQPGQHADDEDTSEEYLPRVLEVLPQEDEEVIRRDGPVFRDRPEEGIEPASGLPPHRVQELVEDDPCGDCEDDDRPPPAPEDNAGGENEHGHGEGVEEESPVPDDSGEEDVPHGLVNEIGEDCPDGAGDEPALIPEDIREEETEEDTREEVEEKVHDLREVLSPTP